MSPVQENQQEEYLTEIGPAPTTGPLEKLTALAEILVAAFLGVFVVVCLSIALGGIAAATGISPDRVSQDVRILFTLLFLDAIVTVAIIWLLQRVRSESLLALGLAPNRWSQEIKIAIAALVGLIGITMLMGVFFQTFLPSWVTRENELLGLLQTPRDLVLFLVASLCVGGFKEELQRAFILDRFGRHLGAANLGLCLWSFVFGVMHLYQGADSAVTAGLLGLALGWLYLRRGRLAAPMLAHAAFNVLMVLAVWFRPDLIAS